MKDLWKDRNWTPMLLKEIDKPFNSEKYFYEVKFDGIRSIIFASSKEIKIYTRNNVDITYLYPELKTISSLVKNNTIFDGEIIIMEKGKPSFELLQKRAHLKDKNKILFQSQKCPVVFIVFDILYDNKNLIDLPLNKRKDILNNYPENESFIISKTIENEGIKLFENIKKLGLEGIVAKEKESKYEISERSDNWLKIKNLKEDIFYIGGYIEKKNSHIISLLLGEYKDNKLYFVGKVSLGKKRMLYKQIKTSSIANKSTFLDFNEKAIYLKTKLKCRVRYLERTNNNHLRHPILV